MTGILHGNGKTWQEQRRFALTTLRDFGFGKQSMEELVETEAAELVNIVNKNYSDKATDPQYLFNIKVLSSIWSIVAGKKLDHFNKELQDACKLLSKTMREMYNPFNNIIVNYPRAFYFLIRKMNLNPMMEMFSSLLSLCKRDVMEHLEIYQDDHSSDFIDAYIKHSQTSQEGSSFHGKDFDLNLRNVLVDIFIAGSETTSTTLTWAVLYMVLRPEIQKKVQDELDTVVGKERNVKISDRPNLHYTNAVVHEIHRRGNIIPFAVPHGNTEDTQIGKWLHRCYFTKKTNKTFFPFRWILHSQGHDRHCQPQRGDA